MAVFICSIAIHPGEKGKDNRNGAKKCQNRAASRYNPKMLSKEEYLRKMQDPHWYGEQDENGVDLSIIEENLRLTPLERLRIGDRATTDALRLRELTRNDPGLR
jgi:hypothetical protein